MNADIAEATVEAAARPEVDQAAPTLQLVDPTPKPFPNVLLYGMPKTGKTIGAASAPKPMLYLNADQPNATLLAHQMHEFDEARIDSLDDLRAAMAALDGETKYRTVVIDSLGFAFRKLLEESSGRALSPAIQHYGNAGTHLERFCRYVMAKPVTFVMVAQELFVETGEEPERLASTGTKNPGIGLSLMADADVIGYTGVVQQEGGGVEYVAQLVNGAGRRGGDRFNVLGTSRAMDLTEWVNEIQKAIGQQPKENREQ